MSEPHCEKTRFEHRPTKNVCCSDSLISFLDYITSQVFIFEISCLKLVCSFAGWTVFILVGNSQGGFSHGVAHLIFMCNIAVVKCVWVCLHG